jgi:hypothetical protein
LSGGWGGPLLLAGAPPVFLLFAFLVGLLIGFIGGTVLFVYAKQKDDEWDRAYLDSLQRIHAMPARGGDNPDSHRP